jgi:hypothetical protein
MWEMIVEEEGYRTRVRKEELEEAVRTKVVKRGWHARSQSLVVKLANCSSSLLVGGGSFDGVILLSCFVAWVHGGASVSRLDQNTVLMSMEEMASTSDRGVCS